ncbi:hypothetical protein [Chondromyces crocatus]|nr:hypothetical protein [Chondromyces crocatus]
MERTGFTTAANGFRFANAFTTTLVQPQGVQVPGVPGLGVTTPPLMLHGLCGGMSFAALDYYFSGIPVPSHEASDYVTPPGVPAQGSRLHTLIYQRHLDSLNLGPSLQQVLGGDPYNLTTYAELLLTPEVLRPVTFGARLAAEVAYVIASVRAGQPVPLGLVAAGGLASATQCHQVVATGFDDVSATTTNIFVYDNRYPGREAILVVTPGAASCSLEVPGRAAEPWVVFFVEHYAAVTPGYLDFELAQGLTVSPVQPASSRRFKAEMVVVNSGEASAHGLALRLVVEPSSAGGQSVSIPADVLGTVPPGQAIVFDHEVEFPGAMAGAQVTVRPSTTFRTPSGAVVDRLVPARQPGTRDLVQVEVPREV